MRGFTQASSEEVKLTHPALMNGVHNCNGHAARRRLWLKHATLCPCPPFAEGKFLSDICQKPESAFCWQVLAPTVHPQCQTARPITANWTLMICMYICCMLSPHVCFACGRLSQDWLSQDLVQNESHARLMGVLSVQNAKSFTHRIHAPELCTSCATALHCIPAGKYIGIS